MRSRVPMMEYVLRLQRRAEAKGYPVYIYLSVDCTSYALYRNDTSTVRQKPKFVSLGDKHFKDIDNDLKLIAGIFEPKFTKITKACVDIIDEVVWYKKEVPYTIKSIISKTEVLTIHDVVLKLEDLYIKDK